MKRLTLHDWLFGALVVWTGVATAIIVARRGASAASPARAPRSEQVVRNWRDYSKRGFAVGPASAATTIVVFSDFQCPYCQQLSFAIDSFARARPDVRIVERHFPIAGLHQQAYDAAIAAECAGASGDYPGMRHALFTRRGLVMDAQWGSLATEAGIHDTAAFTRCVAGKKTGEIVDADLEAGRRLGVEGTPTMLINDSLFVGGLTFAALMQHTGHP